MQKSGYTGPLERIDETTWRVPKTYKDGMRVEGRIFADDRLTTDELYALAATGDAPCRAMTSR